MKHFLLLLFSITILSSLHAQIQKGSVITGGYLNYNTNDVSQKPNNGGHTFTDIESNNLTLAPQVGVFVNESTLIGLGLTYEHTKNKSSYESMYYNSESYEDKRNLFLINPYLTKYSKLKDKLYFTTRLNLMVGFGKHEESKLLAFRANATPGLTYFVSDKWALTCNVGQIYYNRMRSKLTTEDFTNKSIDEDYGLRVSFNTFTVGFQYVINKKSRE
ncbi:hypothetical protein [Marinifilum caeruleilacunae]|uniref:Outer membrane protein beta-barrel domain-containing protein n=1 Tax=Marinifilum caeruleilacunae TaxID=2499076 RepID=A0ABX1WZ14_9BACT|nr:hypothetical protein [Marinifilum caeruleilacunae]NOU61393.1 hypothetical protein [Marinifilum caeruleilacunae]